MKALADKKCNLLFLKYLLFEMIYKQGDKDI